MLHVPIPLTLQLLLLARQLVALGEQASTVLFEAGGLLGYLVPLLLQGRLLGSLPLVEVSALTTDLLLVER